MSAESKFSSFRAWSNILPTKPPEELIEGILVRGRLGLIFAQPENGKTFTAIGVGLSVATGELFGDRVVRKGISIYIAAEAAYDLEVRVPAWRIKHPNAGEPLGGCYGQAVNFYIEREVKLFIDDLLKQLDGQHLELLVIDTLTASMVGGNQDWSKDMTIFINNVRMVMQETGCAVLIVHHAGWKDTSRGKGSIDLHGATDVEIETTLKEQPDGNHIITLTCRKSKSLPPFKTFSITLDPVWVDTPQGSFKSLALGGRAPQVDETPDETPKNEHHARHLVRVLWEHFPEGATFTELEDRSGLKKPTFVRALNYARDDERKWIIGGRGQGSRYHLNPDNSWHAAVMAKGEVPQQVSKPVSLVHPYRGVKPVETSLASVMKPDWNQLKPETSLAGPELKEPVEADPVSKASELVGKVEVKPPDRRKADAQ